MASDSKESAYSAGVHGMKNGKGSVLKAEFVQYLGTMKDLDLWLLKMKLLLVGF